MLSILNVLTLKIKCVCVLTSQYHIIINIYDILTDSICLSSLTVIYCYGFLLNPNITQYATIALNRKQQKSIVGMDAHTCDNSMFFMLMYLVHVLH